MTSIGSMAFVHLRGTAPSRSATNSARRMVPEKGQSSNLANKSGPTHGKEKRCNR